MTVELPIPRQETVEHDDVPIIARNHMGWIMHMMMETMPVALRAVKEENAATGQADQSMLLVDCAMRLGTFVELANASAEAAGVNEPFLVLEYWPATMDLFLRESFIGENVQGLSGSGDRPADDFVYTA